MTKYINIDNKLFTMKDFPSGFRVEFDTDNELLSLLRAFDGRKVVVTFNENYLFVYNFSN